MWWPFVFLSICLIQDVPEGQAELLKEEIYEIKPYNFDTWPIWLGEK